MLSDSDSDDASRGRHKLRMAIKMTMRFGENNPTYYFGNASLYQDES